MSTTVKSNETNKKSELMLMKRARAHSSSCSQASLVYVQCPSILSQFTILQPEITKIHPKPPILGLKVIQGY